MSGGNNWSAKGAGGLYGTYTTTGGGGSTGIVPGGSATGSGVAGGILTARDSLDFARLGSPGRTPEAEYPDGFLGSVNSRRGDRLLDAIGSMNRRSYTRGVHRGERIDPGDYVWTKDWNPQRGLQFQAQGLRQPLAADGPEPRLPYDIGSMPPPTGPVGSTPSRNSQLANLLPSHY